jgi:uncharacterized tellurite resistance protein B-like protein
LNVIWLGGEYPWESPGKLKINQGKNKRMSDSSVVLALAKVLVAAAWADGVITNEEVNCLKDLLFHLKGITAQDWAEIDIYMETPVDETERQRLVQDLEARLSTQADKDQAIQALDQMVRSGGAVGEAELAAVNEIKTSIQNAHAGSIHHWSLFTRNRVQDRSKAVSTAPNREQYMDDFVKNKIYYDVRIRLDQKNIPSQIAEDDLRKLSLAGGLMARVAYVDREVTEGENQVILQALQKYWGTSQAEAALVVEMASSEVSKDLDYYRLTRQFFEATTEDERVRFLDALFAVAAGDGMASFEEIEEIRTISNGLLLSHQQFIDAKLKLPAGQRVD